jgi:hypothetical protein
MFVVLRVPAFQGPPIRTSPTSARSVSWRRAPVCVANPAVARLGQLGQPTRFHRCLDLSAPRMTVGTGSAGVGVLEGSIVAAVESGATTARSVVSEVGGAGTGASATGRTLVGLAGPRGAARFTPAACRGGASGAAASPSRNAMTAHPGRIKSIVEVPFSRPRARLTVLQDEAAGRGDHRPGLFRLEQEPMSQVWGRPQLKAPSSARAIVSGPNRNPTRRSKSGFARPLKLWTVKRTRAHGRV